MLFGNGFGDINFLLHPIHCFLHTQCFKMLGIIGIVIDSGNGGQLVEAFNQSPFCIHIGEAQRPLQFSHSALLAPRFYRIDECLAHFFVVDEVDPTKANHFLIPSAISTVVNDSCYATYNFSILQSQEIFGFTKFESRIFRCGESVEHILVQIRHAVRIVFV